MARKIILRAICEADISADQQSSPMHPAKNRPLLGVERSLKQGSATRGDLAVSGEHQR